ncbi:MAG: hypothetical protein M3Y22_18080 [Pseudomonadota bacterium]|nr:hypothetical protein [Pseudomonadota bacterium]
MNAGFKAEYQQVDRDSAAWRIAAEYQQVDRDSAAWRIAIAGIGDKYRLDSLRPPTLGRAP